MTLRSTLRERTAEGRDVARALRVALGALLIHTPLLTSPSPAVAQPTPSPSTVASTVSIEAKSESEWIVHETLTLSPDSGAPTDAGRTGYMYLAKRCSVVSDVELERNGRVAPLVVTERGPWRMLTDTSSYDAASEGIDSAVIRFRVRTQGGTVELPLVVPTRPLPTGPGGGGAAVHVAVTLPDPHARVTYPRLGRGSDPLVRSSVFPALPSAVHLRLTSDAPPCDQPRPAGDDGGLAWRFWLLVSILAVWVPTYQWWAQRQPEGGR